MWTRIAVALIAFATAAVSAWSEPVFRAPELERLVPVPVGPAMTWPLATGRASVASNGDSWFAVWGDRRAGNLDVFGTRIGADGTILEPLGIAIAPTWAHDTDPAVAGHGDGFVVAWPTPLGVFLVAVTRDGRVLDGGTIQGTEGVPWDAGGTAIASNGSDVVVAWTEYDASANTRTCYYTVTDASRAVKNAKQALPRNFGQQINVTAASSQGRFLLAWTEFEADSRREVFVMDVESASPVSVRELEPSAASSAISLVQATSGYLIATGGIELQVRRLDAAGRPVAPAVTIPGDDVVRVDPAMASIPGGVLLAWTERSSTTTEPRRGEVAQVRLDAAGNPIGSATPLVLAQGGQGWVTLASTQNGHVFAAWRDGRGWGENGIADAGALMGGIVDTSKGVLQETVVARGVAQQQNPSVVAGTAGFLVTWTEGAGTSPDEVFASLVRNDGSFARTNIPVSSRSNSIWHLPVAAASLDAYLVAWGDSEGLCAVRMTRDGEPLDSPPLRFGSLGYAPSIASDGRDFLVTWTRRGGTTTNPQWDFVASAITHDGVVLDPDGTLLADPGLRDSTVSWAGNAYLVTWTVGVSKYRDNVRGAFVSTAGTPLVPVFSIAENQFVTSLSSVSGDAGTMVNWGSCRRLIPNGGPVPGVETECDRFSVGAYDPDPWVAWTGRVFLLSKDPVAVHDGSRAIVAGTRPVRPLPGAHSGEVQRVFFGTFDVGRTRPVRR